ncbi:hypothetical protein [Williamsia sp. CHRR-6]|uniref:hypothetical protein n=1 Tax=Williamsia sp. CHRR-6 TaxID=2835871 RepID=UPI001BDA5E30|nr:hypothetical protein [Williamsia sp. CHRR-6]MBT0565672.1 hypothetical protein [Williamsia sp. CHRR-6]
MITSPISSRPTNRIGRAATAAIAVGAALTFVLSGCSDSDNSSSDAASDPASPATEAAPDVAATELALAESDFPTGGKFSVDDKAAIDKDNAADDKPVITPAACEKVGNQDEGDFDKAKAKWEGEAVQYAVTVELGIDDSFDKVRNDVASCPEMTFTPKPGDSNGVTATLKNRVAEVSGANKPALAVISEGTAKLGTETAAMQLLTIGSYVNGSTVSVSVTKIGGTISDEENAQSVELLNKQIAKVINADS